MTDGYRTIGSDSPHGEPMMVTGLFGDTARLERAYQAVVRRGYGAGDIKFVMSDETRRRYHSKEHQTDVDLGSKALEGGEFGGPIGGTIGTILPALVAVGALFAFPPVGLVAAGPVTVALAGAGVAGLAAGLIGVLSDWGVPEERLKQYAAGIQSGSILMAVKARTEEDARDIEQQWKSADGKFVHS